MPGWIGAIFLGLYEESLIGKKEGYPIIYNLLYSIPVHLYWSEISFFNYRIVI